MEPQSDNSRRSTHHRQKQSMPNALLADSCPLIRKFYPKVASAAQGKPILDIACGTGRNAFPLAELGCTVICVDKDVTRFQPPKNLQGSLILRQMDLMTEPWPFEGSSAGGIVNVHFLVRSLLPEFARALSPGGYLLLETVPGCGGNHRQLPQAGELKTLLGHNFDLEVYREREAGPPRCGAVVVQVLARRL